MMKFINFVSKSSINDHVKTCLTVNVENIKVIEPITDRVKVKEWTTEKGYWLKLKGNNKVAFINTTNYEVIQDFLSNDDKYLKMVTEMIGFSE